MLISWSPQNSPVILNEPKSANRFGTRSGFGQSHEYLKINIRSLRMKANRCQLQGYKGVVVTAPNAIAERESQQWGHEHIVVMA